MIPPVSHPSARELKELHVIALEAAHEALRHGWTTSTFHGFQIHAHSWSEEDGMHLRLVVLDCDAARAIAIEQLHGLSPTNCERGSEPPIDTPSWGRVSTDDFRAFPKRAGAQV